MPATTPCTCAPEIAHALAEVTKLAETLETADRSIPGNRAMSVVYLAMHCLERAGAVCRGESDLDGDMLDYVYVACSIIDPDRRGGYDVAQQTKGALRAMLSSSLAELGLRITPDVEQ